MCVTLGCSEYAAVAGETAAGHVGARVGLDLRSLAEVERVLAALAQLLDAERVGEVLLVLRRAFDLFREQRHLVLAAKTLQRFELEFQRFLLRGSGKMCSFC